MHLVRIVQEATMSTSNDDGLNLSHLREFESVAKKPRLTYHQLKKIIRAKHNCIDMFFVEDKKQMANAEGQQTPRPCTMCIDHAYNK
jgi:hypothetical protein